MTSDRSKRRVVRVAIGAYLVGLAFMLLVPWGDVPGQSIGFLARVAGRLGAPDVVLVPGRLEFVLNVLIVVPVTAGLAWARPQVRWAEWTGYGFLGSLGVEAVQAVFLPQRSATYADVVANTAGALIGSLLGVALRRWYVAPRASRAGR